MLSTLQQRALYYSPLSFLRGNEQALAASFLDGLEQAVKKGEVECLEGDVKIWVRYLEWDSQYFSCPTYRLEFADWDSNTNNPPKILAEQLCEFINQLATKHEKFYLFTEIPSEDTIVLQALGIAGLRLIETRLTYFYKNLEKFDYPRRFSVRFAKKEDTENLRGVAMKEVNHYDRFHADSFFSNVIADRFIATFIEKSIKGFADVVLVPATKGEFTPGAFLTGNFIKNNGNIIGKMVLSAVDISRRGWYQRLIVEMSYLFKSKGIKVAFMTTQSTNKAVIRVWESLGYNYGRTTHLFSTFNNAESRN